MVLVHAFWVRPVLLLAIQWLAGCRLDVLVHRRFAVVAGDFGWLLFKVEGRRLFALAGVIIPMRRPGFSVRQSSIPVVDFNCSFDTAITNDVEAAVAVT
jgi:hypothetical protein